MNDFSREAFEALRAGVTETGRGPYLDSFGPNGVVFPRGSCDTGGHLLRGAEIRDVMKNDPGWIVSVREMKRIWLREAAGIHRQSRRQ